MTDMPKPFGKPVLSGLGFTRSMRLAIALLVTAVPAFFIGHLAAASYPTIENHPFFWTAAIVLAIFYALATARWLKKRPSPRPPGGGGGFKLFVVRFLLTLVLAVPAGLLSAYLYGPALKLANGMLSPGGPQVERAMAVRNGDGDVEIHLLYHEPGTLWKIPYTRFMPKEKAPWMTATLTLRRGLLGARWIEKIDYEFLR